MQGSFIFRLQRRPAVLAAGPPGSTAAPSPDPALAWLVVATLDGRWRRRESVVGADNIVPGSWHSLCRFRRRRIYRLCILGKIRSSSLADALFSILIRTLPQYALQAHEVLIEKNQHQTNIVVKTRVIFICSGCINQVVG